MCWTGPKNVHLYVILLHYYWGNIICVPQENFHLYRYILCHQQQYSLSKNCECENMCQPADVLCALKHFFFICTFFLQTDINMLSIALWWWMECCARLSHFSTEKLLVGLTHTANWYAINLAHSTKAACLLCKGRWAYIKVDWGFRIFLLNERHR